MTKSRNKALTHHKKVILYVSEPAEWQFYDFAVGDRNLIQEWLDGLSEDAENTFHSLLKSNIKVQNPINWTELRYLKGVAKEHRIWELRFHADGRAYRVLGFFGERRKSAILLIGCFHKQQVYDPPDAVKTSITRKRLLEDTKATAIERKTPTDR
jgi:hypothetical protein